MNIAYVMRRKQHKIMFWKYTDAYMQKYAFKIYKKNYKKSKKIYIKNFKCGFNSGKWFIKSIMGVKYLKKICKISWKH